MDDIKEKLELIRESQIRMEQDIKYHIKRTDTLEDYVAKVEGRVSTLERPLSAYMFAKKSGVVAGSILAFCSLLAYIISYIKRTL